MATSPHDLFEERASTEVDGVSGVVQTAPANLIGRQRGFGSHYSPIDGQLGIRDVWTLERGESRPNGPAAAPGPT